MISKVCEVSQYQNNPRATMQQTVGQFGRFLAVGAAATALQYGILWSLVTGLHIPPVTASTVGYSCSALLNYALNRRLTFSSGIGHSTGLPRFIAGTILGLGLNGGLMWIGMRAGLGYVAAQLIATGGTTLSNFTLAKLWVFRT